MKTKKTLVTYSMMRCYCECKAKFRYKYIENLIPKKPPSQNLVFGSLIHDCLESHYKNEGLPAITTRAVEAYPDGKRKIEQIRAIAMMRGYIKNYRNEQLEIIDLEKNFALPIENNTTGGFSENFDLGGKIDAVIELDGELYLMEHKTASSITEMYLAKLPTDFQIHVYSLYAQKLYKRPVGGVLYNILKKTKMKPHKEEHLDDYAGRLIEAYEEPHFYYRSLVDISKTALRRTEQNIWDITENISSDINSGKFYTNLHSCHNFFRECDYYKLCFNAPHLISKKDVIRKYFKDGIVHNELSSSVRNQYTSAE